MRENDYVVFKQFEDLPRMNCHLSTSDHGIINFNFIFKIAKNNTRLNVFRFMASPIKISSKKKTHFLYINPDEKYLVTDPISKLSNTVNNEFYEKCIKSSDFNDFNCNLVMTQPDQQCLPNLFYAKHLNDFKWNCQTKVLGQVVNEVFVISNSMALLYVGKKHKLKAVCNNFVFETYLSKGVFKLTLLDASQCKFRSDSYLFMLHQHVESFDRNLNQIISPNISSFNKYSKTLEESVTLGLHTNNSRDLKELQQELENFKTMSGSQNYAKHASIIGGLVPIFVIILLFSIIFGIYKLNRYYKNSKKIDALRKATTETKR